MESKPQNKRLISTLLFNQIPEKSRNNTIEPENNEALPKSKFKLREEEDSFNITICVQFGYIGT
jgi:hypothetical protein